MGIRGKDIERTSPLAIPAYRPQMILPPNDEATFQTAIALTSYSTIPSAPFTHVLDRPTWGGPAALTVVIATGNAFTGTESFRLEVVGHDEWGDRVSEILTCTGNGAADQLFYTNNLYQYLVSVTAIEYAGAAGSTTPPVGPTVSLGTGGGQVGDLVYVPHPCPGLAFANWDLWTVAKPGTGLAAPEATPITKSLHPIAGLQNRAIALDYNEALDSTRTAALILNAGSAFDLGEL